MAPLQRHADRGRCDGQQLVRTLGLTHAQTPCAGTVSPVLRKLDGPVGDAMLGAWAQSVLTALPPIPGKPEALASDGKPLRGSRQQGAPTAHLLSALSPRVGLTRWQQAVPDKTHEIPVLKDMLQGRVLTVDALLTPRAPSPTASCQGAGTTG